MALNSTVGAADAQSYISVSDADAYFLARANAQWAAASNGDKEAALVRAAAALDAKYRGLWIGVKATSEQALAWPRSLTLGKDDPLKDSDGVLLPVTVIPKPVKDACAEIALIELTSRFLPTAVTREQMVKSKRIDVISTTYFDDAPATTQYPHIDALLQGFATGNASGQTLGMSIGLTEAELRALACDDPLLDSTYFNVG